MTATTITLSGNEYPAYSTLAEAEAYLAPEADALVTAWGSQDQEGKEKLLVRAARFLNGLEFTRDQTGDPSASFAEALEHANARLAAFFAAAPTAEDGSVLVAGQGRVASISAGGVSISYEQSQAKSGDVQVAQSYDELEAIRLGIPELGAYEILKPFLKSARDTAAAPAAAPFRSAPVVRYGTTAITRQLGLPPQDARFDRLNSRGAWPPGGTVLG